MTELSGLRSLPYRIAQFGSMVEEAGAVQASPDTTTEEYAQDQLATNVDKTRNYLMPIIQRVGARCVLDVGCGVGASVMTLVAHGCDAYGVDLPGLVRFWTRLERPRERFFVVDATRFELPFADGTFDLVFSIGVIEHVGTVDGHGTRRVDYEECRRAWIREIWRVVKPGGHLLLGGPNRGFPVDVGHALDSEAGRVERWLSRLLGVSIHRTWGKYFLWSYTDLARYLDGLPNIVEALSVAELLACSRVPAPLRPVVRRYLKWLPRPLLQSGLNPWMMALISRTR